MNMPKLGVTSTTSSDHQNHNHLALSAANQQTDNNPDFNVRFQQQQHQQQLKLPPGIRQPTSWQEQAAVVAANMNNGATPRWLLSNSFQNQNLGHQQQQLPPPNMFPANSVNTMSNSNIMIGQDGDSHNNNIPTSRACSRAPPSSERQQFPAGSGPLNLDGKNSSVQMKQQQSYPWIEGIKGLTMPQLDANKSLQQQQQQLMQQHQQQQQQQRAHEEIERLSMFTYNLYSTYIPGTNKPKKVIRMDSSEGLRQSILNGEFFTRYENIAFDILQNQVIIPEFNIIDYIRRDKSSIHEIERIENVLKRLGISPQLFSLLELVQQPRPPPPTNSSLLMKTSDSRLPPMPDNPGSIDMRSAEQAILDQQIQNVLRNSAYFGGASSSFTNERNQRSSQSPSDNLSSRSHNNNNNLTGLNIARNLPGNQNPASALQNHANTISYQQSAGINSASAQGPTSQTHVNQRNQLLAHSKGPALINPASSVYNPNMNSSRPPPRSQSTILPSIPCRSPQSPYSAYPPRCPPQAHQNSVKSTVDLDLVQNLSNHSSKGPPLLAHQSSSTPQLPKIPIHESLPLPKTRIIPNHHSPPGVRGLGDDKNSNRMHVPSMSGQSITNLPPPRSDIDPASGLPLGTILSLRQQQELSIRNAGNNNFQANQSIGINVSSNDHTRLTNSRPSSNPQIPPPYSPHNQMGGANCGPILGPRAQNMNIFYNNVMASSSMPPPTSDHHKNMNQIDMNGINGPKPIMSPSPNGTNEGPSEAQLKQYSAFMNAAYQQQQHIQQMQLQHQQQNLLIGNQTSLPSTIHNPSPTINSPAGSNTLQINTAPPTSEALLMDMNRRGSLSGDGRAGSISQQPSPRQANQRSIITGSASGVAKKGKKVKHSPPIPQQPVDKLSVSPHDVDKSKIALEATKISMLTAQSKELGDSIGGVAMVPQVEWTVANLSSDQLAIPNENMNDAADSKNASGAIPDSELTKTAPVAAAAQSRGPALVPDQVARDCPKHDGVNNAIEADQHREINGSAEIDTSKTTISESNFNNSVTHSDSLSDNSIAANSNNNLKSKSSTGQDNNTSTSDNIEPQSKYQKLYTKKAWLKNYGLEDQSRSQCKETPENIPVMIKNEIIPLGSPKTDNIPKPTKNMKRKKKQKETPSSKTKPGKKQNPLSKTADNDSGAHSSSTSELDTDDDDSMSVKKLRHMPRRKVKPPPTNNNNNNSSKNGQQQSSPKAKTPARENSRKKIKKEPVSEEPTKEKKDKAIVEEEESTEPEDSTKGATLQMEACYEIVPKSIRCLECRRMRVPSTRGDKTPSNKQSGKNKLFDDFCRFYAFRKLTFNKNSQPLVAGFSDLNDVTQEDRKPWLPQKGVRPVNMNLKVAKFILANIGDQFCHVTMQERAAQALYKSQNEGDKKITWKRAVMGLRELCDVCATTLFNCHYVCEKCGFVVCIECYQSRAKQITSSQASKIDIQDVKEEKDIDKCTLASTDSNENSQKETTDQQAPVAAKKSKRDGFGWIYCARNEEHCHQKLTLSQIITTDCIEEVWTILHEVRDRLKLGECVCKVDKSDGSKIQTRDRSTPTWQKLANSTHSTLKGLLLAQSLNDPENIDDSSNHSTETDCNLQIHEDEDEEKSNHSEDQEMFSDSGNPGDAPCEDIREQVMKTIKDCIASLPSEGSSTQISSSGSGKEIDVCTIGKTIKSETQTSSSQEIDVCNSEMSIESQTQSLTSQEIDVCSDRSPSKFEKPRSDTKPTTHSWLCDSELLVLSEAHQENNIRLFRKQWVQGRPLVVRGVDRLMDIDMWLPQYFGKQFGDYRSDLVDCRNGDIHRHSMKKYWDGFEPSSAAVKRKTKEDPFQAQTANNEDTSNGPSYYSGSALWRLKDWPPGQDFFDILPEHYDDFMNNLPLKPYTTRTGFLNLAYRLPEDMLKPDLGPKMYSAYGTSKFPDRGTTNLHLDISDAINVMIYVNGATSFNKGSDESSESYRKTVMDCCIDQKMKDEIIANKLVPGALWHVFKPCDAPKMREFLNKVSDERDISPNKRTDPIHDQTWYLDQTLLDRLYEEQGVKPYAILQCMGDAVLIPAGAPHQVKNLQNCIKVANDFVSPENVEFCLQLTNEFRSLPETHMNQEDKLQIKNILYHSVKQCLQYIQLFESGEIDTEENFEGDEELDID